MPDWHRLLPRSQPDAVVDPRRRIRLCSALFLALLLLAGARVAQLEWAYGSGFRADANRPIAKTLDIPASRGRILAADGAVLAADRRVRSVAVHYRYFEEPCDETWLRRTARARLLPAQRRDPARVAAEEARVLADRRDLARRLADLCNLSDAEWSARTAAVQAKVERIAESVNRRRQAAENRDEAPSWGRRLLDALAASANEPAQRIVVAEESQFHAIVDDVAPQVAAEIESQPQNFPGVKCVESRRRAYPFGSLAAHVIGHLGPADDGPDPVGRAGLERFYESVLHAERGAMVELRDHAGRLISSYTKKEPVPGRDIAVTIDPRLQAEAESLLDQAIQRRKLLQAASTELDSPPAGGAIVVLDVATGEILASASAPRFDPAWFAGGQTGRAAASLSDPERPLFDRASAMAIPPGSVFKIVSAAALLESGKAEEDLAIDCRGYLDKPDELRCAIFTRHGRGHGRVDLADALAQSCNVFFFHHGRALGAESLADCGRRFGFGRPTGVDLPLEAAGSLPSKGDSPVLAAVGQGAVTATPLQVACMTAAVANGGRLVKPHFVRRVGPADSDPIEPPPQPIDGLHAGTLAAIQEGLLRVVEDPNGTGHDTVRSASMRIAGKTGTAQTGPRRADHAWFAGYAPADRPTLAFVVVVEHAGDGAIAAGPLARRLAEFKAE